MGDEVAAGSGTGRRLVIVESPAKARTIAGFLGSGYTVESSIGHIRDLPSSAAEVPAALKKEAWAKTGVDVDNGFKPLYVVPAAKKAQVAKLKAALKDADELYLATDEDREGEAIAWHLLEVLKPSIPVKRMVFHEITPQAIQQAIDNPRAINSDLVEAQETRRLLDRLYGYEVSPVLWKKIATGLSAGRVQSVATRLVVERERGRMAFVAAAYWDLEATFATLAGASLEGEPGEFTATLASVDGRRLASGRDFAEDGQLRTTEVLALDEPAARALAERLDAAEPHVSGVEEKPYRRSPYAPFITSTLQQEGARKLRWSSAQTMRVAQRLYERGFITYMRTDSTTLSETALTAARTQARELYGDAYVPEKPRRYERKVKNAQEAHEAVRPSGDVFRTPRDVAGDLDGDERRLYELIWQRTVASQMTDATGRSVRIEVSATSAAGETAVFAATGKTITFPGFLRAYVEETDDLADRDDRERRLPNVAVGDALRTGGLEPQGHSTSPPPRFTEASLIKRLEELGVGRPSTYASILTTIVDRGYVFKKGTALVPTFVAFAVVQLMERHLPRVVDYTFTASMEDDLDAIASGERRAVDWLTRFWFGGEGGSSGGVAAAGGLAKLVAEALEKADAREVNSIPLAGDVVVRVGRYGPYLQRGEERASLPDDLVPDELTPAKADEVLTAPSADRALGQEPESGTQVLAKAGRYGPYVTTVPADGEKPRTASLFKTMALESVTLEDALRLLTLPRSLGTAADGEEVTAQNGRYGPYVKKAAESRSLDSEEVLFTVTLEEAMALLAQPKGRRGARTAAPPLKELGPDPVTGGPMVVKEGRFGPYVTDGTTNASLRKADSIEGLSAERGAELLSEKRDKDASGVPNVKKAPARKPAKQAPAKRSPAKRSAAKG